MASFLTPDDIKNIPTGQTVGSVLLNKNLRRIKRPNEKNKVGFQGKTNKPIEAGVKPISAGYKAKPVEAGVPSFNTLQYKNYVEKPPWQKLKIYDANSQFSVLKEMYRYYGLGNIVHPGLALGMLFSPAINSESVSFMFRGENFRNKLKELSKKYQPETITDLITGLPQRSFVQKNIVNSVWGTIKAIGAGSITQKRQAGANEYADWKALNSLPQQYKNLLNIPDKPFGNVADAYQWEKQANQKLRSLSSGKNTQLGSALGLDNQGAPLTVNDIRLNANEYKQVSEKLAGSSVSDFAKQYWSDAVAAYKGKEAKVVVGTAAQKEARGVGGEFKYSANPVIDILVEAAFDPANMLIPISVGAKGLLKTAVAAGKIPELAKFLPQLEKSQTLGEAVLRVGFREGWDNTANILGKVVETPVFRKLADEAGFIRFFGKAKEVPKEVIRFDEPVSPALQKLRGLFDKGATLRKETEVLYSAERGKRFAKLAKVLEEKSGEEALEVGGKVLGKVLPKRKFEELADKFSREELKELIDIAKNDMRFTDIERYANMSTISKLIKEGRVPGTKELEHLETVFGSRFAESIKRQMGLDEETIAILKRVGVDIVNIPKTSVASLDMSAAFRQGLPLIAKHPAKAKAAFRAQAKAFFSTKAYEDIATEIVNKPTYELMRRFKLNLREYATPNLLKREEAFKSAIAEKIPIWGIQIRASERAFIGFLNKLSADVFDDIARGFIKSGLSPDRNPKVFEDLTSFINNATGRGKTVHTLGLAKDLMNGLLFAPRLMASRIRLLNPRFYARLSSPARAEALKTMATFVGTGVTVVGLAKLAGADVEIDPRSSEFLKIKVGKKRYDIWGGFQQYVRTAFQIVSGQTKKLSTGEIQSLWTGKPGKRNILDVLGTFARSKLSPPVGAAVDAITGKTMVGEKVTLGSAAYRGFTPFSLQGAIEAAETETSSPILEALKTSKGKRAAIQAGIPEFFGIGVQTYDIKPSAKNIQAQWSEIYREDTGTDKKINWYENEGLKTFLAHKPGGDEIVRLADNFGRRKRAGLSLSGTKSLARIRLKRIIDDIFNNSTGDVAKGWSEFKELYLKRNLGLGSLGANSKKGKLRQKVFRQSLDELLEKNTRFADDFAQYPAPMWNI